MVDKERLDLLFVDDEDYPSRWMDADTMLDIAYCGARWALEPPKLGLPLLSAQAKAAGHKVASFYRPRLNWRRKAFRELLARKPLAAGITTVAMFDPAQVAAITSEIRAASPGTAIILGGHGAENYPEIRALGDLVITRHGEGALAEVVTALKAGTKLQDIPGVSQGPEGVLTLEGALRYEGIKRVLYPDWDATSTAAWRYPIEASRGCRFSCAFCSFPGKGGQVFRPPEEVVGEMLHLRATRGIRRFDFVDSSLTTDPAVVLELCRLIRKSGLKPDWKCFGRPDAFARVPELAAELAAAGCSRIFMGVESVDDRILSAMRRGMDRAAAELGLERAFAAGLKVHGNFIIGLPGETEATVRETEKFISRRPFSSVYLSTFFASWEMLDLAAREPERFAHLTGKPLKRWRHDGMDYAEAYRLARRAVRRINLSKFRLVAFSPTSSDPDKPPY